MICIYMNIEKNWIDKIQFYFKSFLLNTSIPSPLQPAMNNKLDNIIKNNSLLG